MASALATLAKAFWGICTFRVAPQDIPYSTALLLGVTATNVSISTLIYYQIKVHFMSSLLATLLELFVLFGLTAALLYSFSRTQRTVQTLCALMGAGTVIGAVTLLLLILFPALQVPPVIGIFLLWGIFVWNLSIVAHILRHALVTRFVIGFFIAIGYAIFLHALRTFVDQMNIAAPI